MIQSLLSMLLRELSLLPSRRRSLQLATLVPFVVRGNVSLYWPSYLLVVNAPRSGGVRASRRWSSSQELTSSQSCIRARFHTMGLVRDCKSMRSLHLAVAQVSHVWILQLVRSEGWIELFHFSKLLWINHELVEARNINREFQKDPRFWYDLDVML